MEGIGNLANEIIYRNIMKKKERTRKGRKTEPPKMNWPLSIACTNMKVEMSFGNKINEKNSPSSFLFFLFYYFLLRSKNLLKYLSQQKKTEMIAKANRNKID